MKTISQRTKAYKHFERALLLMMLDIDMWSTKSPYKFEYAGSQQGEYFLLEPMLLAIQKAKYGRSKITITVEDIEDVQ
jgi:hypothetical protein